MKRLKWFLGVVIILSLVLAINMLLPAAMTSSSRIDRDGERIEGSIYTRYQDHIYASVPSNGAYRMDQVDVASFRLISNDFQSRQFAVDQHHVYCANLSLPKLNPIRTRHLGYGYLSDGQHTFYCASQSEPNAKLGPVNYLFQQLLYSMALGAKPQNYIYPWFELESSPQPYQVLLDTQIASNGTMTYFAGQQMPQAQSATLRKLPKYFSDGDQRESDEYFADGQHVYYQHQRLEIKDQPELYQLEVEGLSLQPYLIAPLHGDVYLREIAFNRKHAPYRLLSAAGSHVAHVLFASADGIYFYNTEAKALQRAGDHPMQKGQWTEMAPSIFTDGKRIVYLEYADRWGNNRSPGLKARSTHLYQLDEATSSTWQKLGDVDANFGQVWKNGDALYYFDQLGNGQQILQTIYRIPDRTLANQLITTEQGSNNIRRLVEDKQLIPVQKTKLLSATTRYTRSYYGVFIAIGGFGLLLMFILYIYRRRSSTT
ncbi:DKNYY family protein [Acinetobacter calcoaceticus]|uniref:DKNYY family protein n=1 Tax=Acinetobacter calcoaceticus TaxID=471 RepID=A0A4R1XY22_ACICA|nr:DKNYY family protein [Acinetobacter calcoaceticus]